VEAMLRSAGFAIAAHPEEEVYLCRRAARSGATAIPALPRGAAR
jgi:tRNA (mo5U34)-methyltransferase